MLFKGVQNFKVTLKDFQKIGLTGALQRKKGTARFIEEGTLHTCYRLFTNTLQLPGERGL